MGYYRGDYYRGDYYRGDPFIGGLIARGAAAIGGRLLGRGAAAGAGRAVATRAAAAGAVTATGGRLVPALAPIVGIAGGTALGTATLPAAGQAIQAAQQLVMGGRRRRRMNVLNPRALKRALRRAEGFEKIAKRTVNALHTGPKRFKSTKRRSS